MEFVGRLPRWLAVVAIPLALFLGLVAWGLASPVGASPDDDYHLASIWCGAGVREGICEKGDASDERRVPATLIEYSGCYAFKPAASADCPQEPSTVLVDTDRGNFDASYPPVFYGTLSVFAGPDVALSVVAMRAFNAFLFVGTASALFFVVGRRLRGPLLFGGLATLVPLGMFLIPSVNPSSWAITSAVTLWVALLAYFTSTGKRRIAAGAIAILMAFAASGARSDAAAYSVLALAVVGILLVSRRGIRTIANRRNAVLAIVPVATVVIAAVFFLFAGQASVVSLDTGPHSATTSTGGVLGLAGANLMQLPQLWTGALGTWGLGWLDTALPGAVWASMLAVFCGLIFWGLHKLDRRKGLALLVVFAALVMVPLYILVKDHVMVGQAVQPRYIYPLMIMLVGIALLGFDRVDIGLGKGQMAVVAILVIIANSVALHTNIRRYVTGIDVSGPNLDSRAEWWWSIPISPMGTWALGSVAFAVAVAGIALYVTSQEPPSQTTLKAKYEVVAGSRVR
ncbi:MAG TPA: DUF2142 domain-containing protein [Pseudolysinimonas sp.]|nr:DUF2142 domain-containing protein [Pseudolysinimonas sp.]